MIFKSEKGGLWGKTKIFSRPLEYLALKAGKPFTKTLLNEFKGDVLESSGNWFSANHAYQFLPALHL